MYGVYQKRGVAGYFLVHHKWIFFLWSSQMLQQKIWHLQGNIPIHTDQGSSCNKKEKKKKIGFTQIRIKLSHKLEIKYQANLQLYLLVLLIPVLLKFSSVITKLFPNNWNQQMVQPISVTPILLHKDAVKESRRRWV